MKTNEPRKLYSGTPTKELPKPKPSPTASVISVNSHRGQYTVKDGENKTIFYF